MRWSVSGALLHPRLRGGGGGGGGRLGGCGLLLGKAMLVWSLVGWTRATMRSDYNLGDKVSLKW